MTAIYISPIGYGRFCRLLTIGTSRHVTACRASIPADEPVIITAAEPPEQETCSACWYDTRVKRQRCATVDLTPFAMEIGKRADLEAESPAPETLLDSSDRLPTIEWES